MADPLWLADVLRAEGCKVAEMSGWKGRGHGDFGTVWGSMVHHTGSTRVGPEFIKRGRADLPGPIANVHVDRDGTMNIVAAGVAWHAGTGSWAGIPTNSGNWHVIGFEVDYNGTDYTQAQWDGMVKACAAISRKLGKNAATSVVAHKEYARSQGKWDPGNWDMDAFRRAVQARLDGRELAPAAPPPESHKWVLPAGWYYGPLEGPEESVSGQYRPTPERMAPLRGWQRKAGIAVTGVFDAATQAKAREVQTAHGLPVTGTVTAETFHALMGEKGQGMTTLDTVTKTAVDGSDFRAELWRFIMYADKNSYEALAAVKRVDERLDRIEKLLAERA